MLSLHSNTSWPCSNCSEEDGEEPFVGFSTLEKGTLACILFLISLLAVPANGVVIYVIYRVPSMRTSTNALLLHLCVADLLIAVVYLPFMATDMFIAESWIFGGFMCKMVSFAQSLGTKSSILILTGLSFERYLSVCQPRLMLVTAKRTRIICIALWLIAMASSVPLLVVKTAKPYGELFYCMEDWIDYHARVYAIFVLVLFYFFPLAVMTALYIKIGQKLWQSTKRTNSMRLTAPGKGNNVSKARLTKICIAIILSFALSWAPSHALTIVYFTMEISSEVYVIINLVVFPIVLCVAYSNCAFNPLLYCFMSQNFRNALSSEWQRLTKRKSSMWSRLPGIKFSVRQSTRTLSSRFSDQQPSMRADSNVKFGELQGTESRLSVVTIFESSV